MERAKIIADSISREGYRLTTMEVVLHRFILAEFNTHRAFSRNSASSRAIPVEKRINMVANNPALPLSWGKNQKGMQAPEEIGPEAQRAAEHVWHDAANCMIICAKQLMHLDVHKQVVNRLLEPFVYTTVLVSATEWENFFAQRCTPTDSEPLAAPEMYAPADAMRDAYRASTPTLIEPGGWHLPYISNEERSQYQNDGLRRISVARCARVSTLTQDGTRNVELDLKLYDRLATAKPPHASPMEHIATPNMPGSGNFTGWLQYRHCVDFGRKVM